MRWRVYKLCQKNWCASGVFYSKTLIKFRALDPVEWCCLLCLLYQLPPVYPATEGEAGEDAQHLQADHHHQHGDRPLGVGLTVELATTNLTELLTQAHIHNFGMYEHTGTLRAFNLSCFRVSKEN